MKRPTKRQVLQHLKIGLYRIAVLGLIATAVWDASKIIREYLYNNRMTHVEQRYIEDKLPFLENPKVCLWYPGKKTILHDAWAALNESDLAKFAYSEPSQAYFCDDYNSSEAIQNFTFQDKYDLIKILNHIEDKDNPKFLFVRSPYESGQRDEK